MNNIIVYNTDCLPCHEIKRPAFMNKEETIILISKCYFCLKKKKMNTIHDGENTLKEY